MGSRQERVSQTLVHRYEQPEDQLPPKWRKAASIRHKYPNLRAAGVKEDRDVPLWTELGSQAYERGVKLAVGSIARLCRKRPELKVDQRSS